MQMSSFCVYIGIYTFCMSTWCGNIGLHVYIHTRIFKQQNRYKLLAKEIGIFSKRPGYVRKRALYTYISAKEPYIFCKKKLHIHKRALYVHPTYSKKSPEYEIHSRMKGALNIPQNGPLCSSEKSPIYPGTDLYIHLQKNRKPPQKTPIHILTKKE